MHQPYCGMAIIDWEVPPMESVEEAVEVGVLPIDYYSLDLFFGDTGAHYASPSAEVVQ